MYIGEISKPSVDRDLVKKVSKVRATEAVAASKEVSALVELSDEARHQYGQDLYKQDLLEKELAEDHSPSTKQQLPKIDSGQEPTVPKPTLDLSDSDAVETEDLDSETHAIDVKV